MTSLRLIHAPDDPLARVNLRGASARVADIFGKAFNISEDGSLWTHVSADGGDEAFEYLPAGRPFALRFRVYNPRIGQPAPADFAVLVQHARVGAQADVTVTLPTAPIVGCPERITVLTPDAGSSLPMFVYAAQFETLQMAQSSSAPRAANMISVTFSTNVPLSRRCEVVITLSGLAGVSGALPSYTQPGMRGTRWRSDSCPVPARDMMTLEPAPAGALLSNRSLVLVTNVSLYGAAPLDGRAGRGLRFRARGGPLVRAPKSCGVAAGAGVLASCIVKRADLDMVPYQTPRTSDRQYNGSGWGDGDVGGGAPEGMCLYDEQLYAPETIQEWQRREALLALFQGQPAPTASYERQAAMPRLGDGVCDQAWNCDDYSWDLGDCLSENGTKRVPDIAETAGAALWDQHRHSLVMFLREDTAAYTEYAFSFQVANGPRLAQADRLALELSGIVIPATRVATPPLPYPHADRALCSTGGTLRRTAMGDLVPRMDATPLNTYSASLVDTTLTASSTAPGMLNTLTVTLAVNSLVTERLGLVLTVRGLKGAMWTSGLIQLSSASGDHLLFQSPYGMPHGDTWARGGTPGYGYWNNTLKSLTVSVAGTLKEFVPYVFSFNVVNPPAGQSRPTILIGSSPTSIGLSTCPPWARPLSTRVKLRVYNTTTLLDPASSDPYYPAAVMVVTYTLTSIEDGTVIRGCSLPVGNAEDIVVPTGKWYLTLSADGMLEEDVEVKADVSTTAAGDSQMIVAQGSACRSSTRSIYQDCTWWPRPDTSVNVFMQRVGQPRTARLVLLWGAQPRDLDVSVQFRNIRYTLDEEGSPTAMFAPARGGGQDCFFGDILTSGARQGGGGGVYWGCRSQKIMLKRLETGLRYADSEVTIERRGANGFGPEVIMFHNVPDGEYHVTVRVVPPDEGSTTGARRAAGSSAGVGDMDSTVLLGSEEVKVYLPDGARRQVYTTVRGARGGLFWHVGYLRVSQNRAATTWVTLNYDQLASDPQTYRPGLHLHVHVDVRDSKTNLPMPDVKYKCYSAGRLANAGTLLSQGNLPETSFAIQNQIYRELATAGTIYNESSDAALDLGMEFPKQEYRVVLSKSGFMDATVIVSFVNRTFSASATSVMVPVDRRSYVIVNWGTKKDLDLYLLPCANTGRWSAFAPECPSPLLAQGVLYPACREYRQMQAATGVAPSAAPKQAALKSELQNKDGSGPEMASMLSAPAGFYDIWVRAVGGVPFDGTETVEVRLASGNEEDAPTIRSETVTAPKQSPGGSAWWHVGYVQRTFNASSRISSGHLTRINRFSSAPTSSGCRIASETKALNASGGTVTLSSGIAITVFPGAYPLRRASTPDLSVSQLEVVPAPAPAGTRIAAPVIYLEPSGTQFNAPGVNISMPLDSALALDAAFAAAVYRFADGKWTAIDSADVVAGGKITRTMGNTRRFSAYALIVAPKQAARPSVTSKLPVATTPPPRVQTVALLSRWWMRYLVFPAGGLVALLLMMLCCFRVRYGRLPYRPPKKVPVLDEALKPTKTKGQNALRLKLLSQEEKSRERYSTEKELSSMGELMRESIEEALADESRAQQAPPEEDGSAAGWKVQKKDADEDDAGLHAPPHPISALVRSGVLEPPRSSVVDGLNRKMLGESGGAGGTEKVEVDDMMVVADFGRDAHFEVPKVRESSRAHTRAAISLVTDRHGSRCLLHAVCDRLVWRSGGTFV